MAEPLDRIDVLVGDIDATGERDQPVHHRELAVIAVVVAQRQPGAQLVERLDAHPGALQILGEVVRKVPKRSEIVIHDPDLHPFARLA